MPRPSRTLATLAAIFLTNPALAVEITVGETSITVPVPEGFAAVTDDVQPFADFTKRLVPAINVQFAYFVPAEFLPALSHGEIPAIAHTAYVQSMKQNVGQFFTNRDFEIIKQRTRSDLEADLIAAKKQIVDQFQDFNHGISQDFGTTGELSLGPIELLSVHEDRERSMAYSMYVTNDLANEDGSKESITSAVTINMLHVKGKILLLYVTTVKDELKSCRTQAQSWAEQVIAANPSDERTAAREQTTPHQKQDSDIRTIVFIVAVIVVGLTIVRSMRARKG